MAKDSSKVVKMAVIALYIISFIQMANQLTNSLVAYIMQSYPDVAPTTVRTLMTLPSLFSLVVSFIIGPIALRFSKKWLQVISAGCIVVYFAIFSIVGSSGPFWLLLVASAFAGFGLGSGTTLTAIMIAEFVPAEKRDTIYSITNALQNAGIGVINMVGGSVAAGNGGTDWPKAYWFGAIVVVFVVAFAILMPEDNQAPAFGAEEKTQEKKAKGSLKNMPAGVWVVALFNMLFTLASFGFRSNVSEYVITTYELGDSTQAGFAMTLFTYVGLAAAFSYGIWIKLFKKWLLPVSCLVCSLGFAAMIFCTESLIGVYLAGILVGFGRNLVEPYAVAEIMRVAANKTLTPIAMSIWMGTSNLILTVSVYIYEFFSPVLGGGIHGNVVFAGILMFSLSIISVFIFCRNKQNKEAC